jgi:hypothetical protein
MATFQQRLEQIRNNFGLSIPDAADRIGISEQCYTDFEAGPLHPSRIERLGLLSGLGHTREEALAVISEPDSSNGLEFLERQMTAGPRLPFVRIQDGTIEVIDRSSAATIYEIAADRVTSPEMVMRWIEHLSGKTWVTKQHLREFVRVCSDHLGTSLHPVG